jgi:hypothetical protein
MTERVAGCMANSVLGKTTRIPGLPTGGFVIRAGHASGEQSPVPSSQALGVDGRWTIVVESGEPDA